MVLRRPNKSSHGDGWTIEEFIHILQREVGFYHHSGEGLSRSSDEALLHTRALLSLLIKCMDANISVIYETCVQVPKIHIE